MDFISHHGIKGQKWGVRRYQNEDGTLTSEGQKRYAEYKMLTEKAKKQIRDNNVRINQQSVNDTILYMNNGGTAAFDAYTARKFGKKYRKSSKYQEDYLNFMNQQLEKNYNKRMSQFVLSNKEYNDVRNFCKKYEMSLWSQDVRNDDHDYELLKKWSRQM